jgi:hypothetical protein
MELRGYSVYLLNGEGKKLVCACCIEDCQSRWKSYIIRFATLERTQAGLRVMLRAESGTSRLK